MKVLMKLYNVNSFGLGLESDPEIGMLWKGDPYPDHFRSHKRFFNETKLAFTFEIC